MKNVRIDQNDLGQKGLFAERNFKAGEVILCLKGSVSSTPTKYTIEVGENEHITDEFGTYLNHSCDPNTKIQRKGKRVLAKKDIKKGEELSFDYNSNETKMATPFECACGSKNCKGRIRGLKDEK